MTIRTQGLTKIFPNGRGIFDISLEVKEGEVFGYLGPNGAGKTTTIRHFLGFLQPTSGTSEIKGLDCWNQSPDVQKSVGYLPGEIAFLEGMSGREFLNLISGMRGITDNSRREKLINRFQFDTKTQIRKMSKGMKQKLGLVVAFMHDPKILVLDEPSAGLDPLMQKMINELILEEKSRGKTIFMSSHNFEEIERTCDRIAIIKEGKLVTVEDIHKLKSIQRKVFIVTLRSPSDVEIVKESGLEIIQEDYLSLYIAVQGNYDYFIEVLSRCGVYSLSMKTQSLEEVFMNYYRKEGQV